MISVIVCSADDTKFAQVKAEYGRVLHGTPHELVGVRDARSLCEGYTEGMRRAHGDVLVFSHDDVGFAMAPEAFRDSLRAALDHADVIGVAGTSRLIGPSWSQAGQPFLPGQVIHFHPEDRLYMVGIYGTGAGLTPDVCALDGVFIAARREVAERVGFDAASFGGFHFYDLDFTFRAWRAGLRIAVANEIDLVHFTRAQSYDASWHEYTAVFMRKHGAFLHVPPIRQGPTADFLTVYTREFDKALELVRRSRSDAAFFAQISAMARAVPAGTGFMV